MKLATFEATANIAVVKYWGKRDEKLILPKEGSLSFTMDDSLKTRTTVAFDASFKEDEFWLNGVKMDLKDKDTAERLQQLDLIRAKAGIREKAKIVSLNCFPTAAGFASSAAGLAALACAASKAAGLNLSTRELSILARLGSGSACRSVTGGFVEWKRGTKEDGSDSVAEQVAPANHWPELRNVIAVTDQGKKKVSSRAGMKQTVATSALYPARLAYLPKLIADMKAAVLARDFPKFGELTMRESSNMHAVMLDTWPPIMYLNDVSKAIVYAVHDYNTAAGGIVAAYTFDAGPNAHVYTTAKHEAAVRKMLSEIEGVQKTITCSMGEGPKQLKEGHLIDAHGAVLKHSFDEKSGKIIIK
ncbi:MAG: diphosphomevalonate decarboxylase [Candidatus Micrarchaeia archaeon]